MTVGLKPNIMYRVIVTYGNMTMTEHEKSIEKKIFDFLLFSSWAQPFINHLNFLINIDPINVCSSTSVIIRYFKMSTYDPLVILGKKN